MITAILLLASCTPKSDVKPEAIIPKPIVTTSSNPSLPQSSPVGTPMDEEDKIGTENIRLPLLEEGAKLEIQYKIESRTDCRYVIQYPQLFGLVDKAFQRNLNERLRQYLIKGIISETEAYSRQAFIEGNRCPYKTRKAEELRTDTSFCEVHFAEDSLISLACTSFTIPGAYPHIEIHPVTFDLETGKIYELSDLFKPNSNWAVRLAVSMRDTWWITGPNPQVSFPYKSLESGGNLTFYLQEECNQTFGNWGKETVRQLDDSSNICMVFPNLGHGASRGYLMPIKMEVLEEILDASGALKILAEKIDSSKQYY